MRSVWIIVLLVFAACQTASESETDIPPPPPPVERALAPSPEGSQVYFIAPEDGATLAAGEVKVVFGLSGMGIAPAGIDVPETGHHHLLVNVSELPPLDAPVPSDSVHLHYGKGQTETVLNLEPGSYTLQLVLGDMLHIPHDPPVISDIITITVE